MPSGHTRPWAKSAAPFAGPGASTSRPQPSRPAHSPGANEFGVGEATALSNPAIILLSGIPGAGKTTVGRILAGAFERGVHIEADQLQMMVVSGAEWPSRQITPEAERQMSLRLRNACLLASSFADAGFTVVVDDVLIAFRLDEYRRLLEGSRLYYVLLLPNREALRQRNRGRVSKDVFETWEFLDDEVRSTARRGLWLDTTDTDQAATAALIVRRLEEARL